MIANAMRKPPLPALILLAMLAASPPASASGRPVDPIAAFSVRQQVDVVLSPDGRMLAWRQANGTPGQVVIYGLATRTPVRTVTVSPKVRVRGLTWANRDTLLLRTSGLQRVRDTDGRPLMQFRQDLAVNVASGRMCKLPPGVQLLAWNIDAPHTVIASLKVIYLYVGGEPPRPPAPGGAAGSFWMVRLLRVDTDTCKALVIGRGDVYTTQWIVDASGHPVARLEYRPQEKRHYILVRRGKHDWQQIYQHIRGGIRLGGLTEGGHAILAIIRGSDGRGRLWSIPLDQSMPRELMTATNQSIPGFYLSRRSGEPLGVWLGGAERHVHWLDRAAEMRYESLARLFPGRHVRVYDHSTDGNELLAKVQGPANPPMYYLVNFATHRADIAGESYPQLDHIPLGRVRQIKYPTSRGRSIQASLILPPGGTDKHLPLIVLVPGGPNGDSPFKFDWLGQSLALEGYAVLRPEVPRARPNGFEKPRHPAIEWGGASQLYAADGVRALIKRGVADRKRVCIVGTGYGGYAALAGAAFTPDLYACAISINGISDLPSFLAYQHGHATRSPVVVEDCAYSGECAYWKAELGSQADSKLAAESPVDAAAQITAPVLLMHSEDDPYVPVSQSEEMARALSKLGKPVTLLKLGGADHRLSSASTRTEVLRAANQFLDEHLH